MTANMVYFLFFLLLIKNKLLNIVPNKFLYILYFYYVYYILFTIYIIFSKIKFC